MNISNYKKSSNRLVVITLLIWFFFSFVVHFFVDSLSTITILGFPLGYYMAAQGSLIAFIILLFWFVARQEAIDVKYGVDEDATD